jgi:hypothetical protein
VNKYQIILGSPPAYNDLVAYIVLEGEYIAVLDKDLGDDKLRLEIFEREKPISIDYNTFLNALAEAKVKLLM